MNFETYKSKIVQGLSNNFDIQENHEYENVIFDIFAGFNVRNERYIVTKKATIYAFENNEFIFLKKSESFNEDFLEQFIKTLKKSIEDLIDPHNEHMSTTITGVIVVDKIEENDSVKKIKRFNYQKGFMFGFKGWADIRIVLVGLKDNKVVTSKKAKKVDKFYRPL